MAFQSPTTLDLSGLEYLLPDEDPATFTEFRDALLEDLAPCSAYQKCLAMNLVGIEWDIGRHRRLLAAAIRNAFRRQSFTVAVNEIGRRGCLAVHDAGAAAENEYAKAGSEHYGKTFARNLLNHEGSAATALAKAGVTPSEITAEAQRTRAIEVAYHEDRIAELERRRRALLADCETLKSRRPAAEAIEDAVVVT